MAESIYFPLSFSSLKGGVGEPPLATNEVVQDLKHSIFKLEEEVLCLLELDVVVNNSHNNSQRINVRNVLSINCCISDTCIILKAIFNVKIPRVDTTLNGDLNHCC